MHFFNLDLHCAVIEDVTRIFKALGHQVTSVNLTGHNWVFGRQAVTAFGSITTENWPRMNSPEQFYREHKDELSKYDGFITTFPPAFAKLYERFDKPIIMYVPLRYEMPYHQTPDWWLAYNNWIQKAVDNKQLFLAANSRFDQEHMEGFVERSVRYIPNLCDYTGVFYNPEHSQALLSQVQTLDIANLALAESKGNLQYVRHLNGGRYSWKDIVKYSAFVHIPYNCGSMSFFEHYAMRVPMLIPSMDFLMSLRSVPGVLCDIGWESRPAQIISHHRLGDPNDARNAESWLPLYDFYNENQYPHLLYFDSWEHMRSIIADKPRLLSASEKMKQHNGTRRETTLAGWAGLLSEVEHARH